MASTSRPSGHCGLSPEVRDRLTLEFRHHLECTDLAGASIRLFEGAANHFLTWIELEQFQLETVDDNAVRRFRLHDCSCPLSERGLPRHKRRTPQERKTMHGVEHLVQFLEGTGYTDHPQEGALGRQLLADFLVHCDSLGFSASVRRKLKSHSSHFLIWCHRMRKSIKSVNREVLNDFLEHECACPRYFIKPRKVGERTIYALLIRKFVTFLGHQRVAPVVFLDPPCTSNSNLGDFRRWLAQYRGVTESTIHTYCRLIAPILERLGDDPIQYNARRLREVVLDHFRSRSVSHTQNVIGALRMYLRFLATREECNPYLLAAIPTPKSRTLLKPPRYIPMEDIERLVSSCDVGTAAGLRDRAILLLLARLALRAGDISALQLTDIDWRNGRLRVCGKSRRSTWLPLPQDAGDALLDYITTVRPDIPTGTVFLRIRAPKGPLGSSHTIKDIVSSAIRRTGVVTPGNGGAYLFRHSVATDLLRSGASLSLVGTLLRHQSPDTTSIYAKADVRMLHEVAQPWIGGSK